MALLIGGVVESLRNIALSTTVTLLVPDDGRDKANGLVGTVQGISFMITSVFSGLSVGLLGMGWTLAIAIALTGTINNNAVITSTAGGTSAIGHSAATTSAAGCRRIGPRSAIRPKASSSAR